MPHNSLYSFILKNNRPLDYWNDRPTSELNHFVSTYQPLVDISCKQAANLGRGFQTIDSYFSAAHLLPEVAAIIADGPLELP